MIWRVLSVFVLLCLFESQAAKSKNLLRNRIIGGKNATRGQFPYHVALANRNTFSYDCGASIITNRHILSVAHFIKAYENKPFDLLAVLGTSNIHDSNFTAVDIEKVYVHPDFVVGKMHFDISIILTRQTIQFSATIQPIRLPTSDLSLTDRVKAVTAGWGVLKEPVSINERLVRPQNLQYQYTHILSVESCKELFQRGFKRINYRFWSSIDVILDETTFCTTNAVGFGTCNGDSGDGIVVNNTLIGMTSISINCARGLPDVNINVFSYMPWINAQIERSLNGWNN